VLVAENKTEASAADPDASIAAITDESRRSDCAALIALMSKATKQPPVMWGTAVVGFGTHKYPLAGGKVGEICSVGLSSRKGDISICGVTRGKGAEQLLVTPGKHEPGKGCLYVNRPTDVDTKVLEKLVVQAFKAKQG
jgi:hypothetical protein